MLEAVRLMNTLQKKLVAFALAASAAALPIVAACSNNAEGERCDVLACNGPCGPGNEPDCQDGLHCTSKTDLNGASSDLCCPPDRTTASTPQCQVAHAPVGGDAGVPGADSGPPADTGTNEAAVDGGGDGGAPIDASDAGDGNATNG